MLRFLCVNFSLFFFFMTDSVSFPNVSKDQDIYKCFEIKLLTGRKRLKLTLFTYY